MLAKDVTFDLNDTTHRLQALGLTAITLVLIYLCMKALLSHGNKGDYSKSFSVVGSVFICLLLLPLAAGTGATAAGYGDAVLNLLTSFFSAK